MNSQNLEFSSYFESIHIQKDLPLDEEGYVKSFRKDEVKELSDFFDKYGFVVIQQALDEKECAEMVDDVWTYIEQENFRQFKKIVKKEKVVSRDDPSTWNFSHGWDDTMAQEGIIGTPAVFTQRCWNLRENKVLHEVGKNLLQTDRILASIDRYGCFRPTKINPTWQTLENLHIDMNPWVYYDKEKSDFDLAKNFYNSEKNFDFCAEFNSNGHFTRPPKTKIQAQFNFLDNKKEDGGFYIVPGMHKALKEWSQHTSETLKNRYSSLQSFIMFYAKIGEDVIQKDTTGIFRYGQRITSRKGSLILWNQLCPHGSSPNQSMNLRMAAFFKIFDFNLLPQEQRIKRAKHLFYVVCQKKLTFRDARNFGFDELDEKQKQEIQEKQIVNQKEIDAQAENLAKELGLVINQ